VSHLLPYSLRNDARGHQCGTADLTIEVGLLRGESAPSGQQVTRELEEIIASSSPGDPLVLIGRERRAM